MRLLVGSALGVLATLVATAASVAAPGPPPCTTDCATAVTPPTADAPFGITRGPLGSIWFSLADGVARIDRQGQITIYPVRVGAVTGWLTTEPESDIWFAERGTGRIGVIHADGTIREYALPLAGAVPQGIVFAPNGDIYVTEQGSNAIARIDPATGAAIDYPAPTPNATVQSGVLGPDGAIWFIERAAAKVGRMTLDGQYTEHPLAAGAFPNRIIVGPDGALWFTELFASKVGRITTNGQLTEYPVPGGPVGITLGRDRQIYVALFNGKAVTRLNSTGEVTGHWALPGAAGPLQIATGFGLDIWVTDTSGGKLYELTPYATGR